jgi:hypothetical protein
MKNINKNSIFMGFKVLSIMAFSLLFIPISASAASNYVWGTPDGINYNYGNYNATNYNYNPAPTYVPPPTNTTPPSNPSTIYSGGNTVTKSTTTKKTTTVAKANTNTSTGSFSGYMLVPVSGVQYTQTASAIDAIPYNPNTNQSLAASVILGTNSFLPSGIMQWILLAILILIIVILARRIFGGTQKYMQVPLKHA